MPQRIDYPTVPGKRWEWHYVLLKEWLRTVQPGLGERKYAKWLRTRKVFERRFIGYGEQLLGLERQGREVVLGEVGEELVEALDAAEAAAEKAQAAALERGPGRDMPRPGPTGRTARPPARRGGGDEDDGLPDGVDGGGDAAPALGPPTPETDPFLRALLERFTELNPYLSMFALREIADGFLAPTELMRRIGSASFEGARPNMQQLEGWITWLEWLGGLRKVGFRHKAGAAAREIAAYLVEMPLEELLAGDDEPDEAPAGGGDADEEAAEEAPAPSAAARRPAPVDEDEDEDDGAGGPDGDDDDEFDDEGLDLPPSAEAAPDAEAYWRREPAGGGSTLGALTRGLAALDLGQPETETEAETEAEAEAETETETEAEAPETEADRVSAPVTRPVPAASPGPAAAPVALAPPPAAVRAAPPSRPAGTSASTSAPPVAPAPTTAPTTAPPAPMSAPSLSPRPVAAPALPPPGARPVAPVGAQALRAEAVRQALDWWLDEPPGPSLAQAAGIRVGAHPSGKPVGLFKLLALAGLLEAGTVDEALALFRAIDAALEAHVAEGAPLEQVLEAAWAHGAPPALEERLVHLPRWRRALLALPFKALSPSQEARVLLRTLRDAVTGPTLGAGLVVVVRELARSGWRLQGVDAIEWLPFPPAAAAAEAPPTT
ncbi:MAG: hypothetical protein M9894_34510 [Planctomycetes bacterium]|nr:hypothetical protein [Planctomycetota bacterium]